MLHQRRRWTSRHAGDLAAGTDRISVERGGDPLQPAEDDRGFLEPTASWRRQLRLHGGDARILPLTRHAGPPTATLPRKGGGRSLFRRGPEERPGVGRAGDLATDRARRWIDLPHLARGSPRCIEPLAVGAEAKAVDRFTLEDALADLEARRVDGDDAEAVPCQQGLAVVRDGRPADPRGLRLRLGGETGHQSSAG